MSKKLRDILLSLDWMIFLLLSAVLLTVLISPLIHQMDIERYDLQSISGLNKEMIQAEYHRLTSYLWIWNREPLELAYFTMSKQGAIHFADVKRLFDFLQVVWLVSGIIGISFGYRRIQKHEYEFIKYAAWLSILGPLSLGALASVNFNAAFTLFHQICFSNDYWIFDAMVDPVILILPEGFFMHCFIAIVLIVILLAAGLLGAYRYFGKKELKSMS